MDERISCVILTILINIYNIYNFHMIINNPINDNKDNEDNEDSLIKFVGSPVALFGLMILIQLVALFGVGFFIFSKKDFKTGAKFNLVVSSFVFAIQEYLYGFGIKDNLSPIIISPFSNYQLESKSPFTIDSMFLFKISYLILMIFSLTYAENKTTSVLIVIAFGFFFQLFNNLILYFLSNKEVIPSVFMYLNEYMKNSNINDRTKQGKFYEIMGVIRLSIIFVISIIIAYHFKVKGRLVEFLGAFTLIFTLIIATWQLFIGDECILNRTFNQYKGSYIDNKEYKKDFKMIMGSLQEIIQAQGGLFFNTGVLLLAVALK